MRKLLALALSLAAVSTAGCFWYYEEPLGSEDVQPPPVNESVGIFYDELAPHGEWFWDVSFGWVWTPYGVGINWAPYIDGHWAWTEYGWTWVSDWEWGWAPFHYGRWWFDDGYGWIWIPGYVWGPGWVMWRWGDGYCGWAPIPPGYPWKRGEGFRHGLPAVGARGGETRGRAGAGGPVTAAELDAAVPSSAWSFVPRSQLLNENIGDVREPRYRNLSLLETTRNVTNYAAEGDRVVNRSLDPAEVSKAIGRTVPMLHAVDVGSPELVSAPRGQAGTIGLYRPSAPMAPRSQTISPPGSQEWQQAHEAQQQELERRQLSIRQGWQQDWQQRMANPPANVPPAALERKQQMEQRSMDQQFQREQRVLRQWQQHERQMPIQRPDTFQPRFRIEVPSQPRMGSPSNMGAPSHIGGPRPRLGEAPTNADDPKSDMLASASPEAAKP